MKRRALIVAAVALAAGAVVLARPPPTPVPASLPAPVAAAPGRLPKLLDLGATSCIPCKAMVPVLDSLKTDYAGRLEVEFIDVWKHREAAETWGVSSIPTQVFIAADGRELDRHQGFMSRDDILARWAALGVAL
jgi:thioredoxin 1